MSRFTQDEYYDGSIVSICLTPVDTFWPAMYFITMISLFFILPFLILLVLYTIIARSLMKNPGMITNGHRGNIKYRKQVIFMLAAVVLSFFICLLPFRAFTLWIIVVPAENILHLGVSGYYSLLYFCRIMLYINSALNPVLYNLMSSKFRDGFFRLIQCRLILRSKSSPKRNCTFHTTSTNLSSSHSVEKHKSSCKKNENGSVFEYVETNAIASEIIIHRQGQLTRQETIHDESETEEHTLKPSTDDQK